MCLAVILPAAGIGSRLSGVTKKQYQKIENKEIFIYTLEQVFQISHLKEVVMAVASEDLKYIKSTINHYFASKEYKIRFVEGGVSRQHSVWNALQEISPTITYVAVHDIVRPFASSVLFDRVLQAALAADGAIPVIPIKSTLKKVNGDKIEQTLDRHLIKMAQTPQIFKKEVILQANQNAKDSLQDFTDDAQIVEASGYQICVVEGDEKNIKITTHEDLLYAEYLARQNILQNGS